MYASNASSDDIRTAVVQMNTEIALTQKNVEKEVISVIESKHLKEQLELREIQLSKRNHSLKIFESQKDRQLRNLESEQLQKKKRYKQKNNDGTLS